MHDKQAPRSSRSAVSTVPGRQPWSNAYVQILTPACALCEESRRRDSRTTRIDVPVEPMPDAYEDPWPRPFDGHRRSFPRHFETTLTPLLDSGHLHPIAGILAITCGDTGTAIGAQIVRLQQVPRPSLTIYLAVDEVTATEHAPKRSLLDDEHLEMLRAPEGLRGLFQQYDGPLLRIPSVSAEETYQAARDGIRARLGL